MLDGKEDGEGVCAEDGHEVVAGRVGEAFRGARDARVGEHDVQPAVLGEGFVDDGFQRGLVGGIEAARVHFDAGVEGLQFADVDGEVLICEVANVDCAGAIVGELMGGGASDALWGVGAGDDYHFVFYSSILYLLASETVEMEVPG